MAGFGPIASSPIAALPTTPLALTGLAIATSWSSAAPSNAVSILGASKSDAYSKGGPILSFAAAGTSTSIASTEGAGSAAAGLSASSFSAGGDQASATLQLRFAGALFAASFAQGEFVRSAILAGKVTAMAAGMVSGALATAIGGQSTSASSSKGSGFRFFTSGLSFAMAAARGAISRTIYFGGYSKSMLELAGNMGTKPAAVAGRYFAQLLLETLLKDDQPSSYITRWVGNTDYITGLPDETYIKGVSDVYIATFARELLYIASTRETNMPQARDLPPIDATVQQQTITLDFGDGSYLPAGVTLTGTPVVTLQVVWGDDPDPASRLLNAPSIGTAPKPYGSGRPNTAVLVKVGNFPGQAGYLLQGSCARTDGDVASMDVKFDARVP